MISDEMIKTLQLLKDCFQQRLREAARGEDSVELLFQAIDDLIQLDTKKDITVVDIDGKEHLISVIVSEFEVIQIIDGYRKCERGYIHHRSDKDRLYFQGEDPWDTFYVTVGEIKEKLGIK